MLYLILYCVRNRVCNDPPKIRFPGTENDGPTHKIVRVYVLHAIYLYHVHFPRELASIRPRTHMDTNSMSV